MKPIILAFSLIRVPRLFVSLLFWPMVVGVGIAFVQAVSSSAYFGVVTETSEQFQNRLDTDTPEDRWLRAQLYGSTRELEEIQICRWQNIQGKESPPNSNCSIKKNDVVIQVKDPQDYQIEDYARFFNGSTRTLHLCSSCKSEVVITPDGENTQSNIHGLPGLGIMMLTDSSSSKKAGENYVEARRTWEKIREISGTIFLHPSGLEEPINISQATKTMLLIINTSLITVIALWLSLRGHRKVLDYFSRNGALLPLVAACGKNTFYTALWIITLFRVLLFLIAALPATVLVYARAIPQETLNVFIRSAPDFILWLAALITSLSCLAIIASVAELKQRHSWVSFLYRYVPLALCWIGTMAWFIAAFTPGEFSKIFQIIIACIPIVGISPVLISPLFNLSSTIVAAHSLIATFLIIVFLRANSRWFAAHLEEI